MSNYWSEVCFPKAHLEFNLSLYFIPLIFVLQITNNSNKNSKHYFGAAMENIFFQAWLSLSKKNWPK